MGENFFFFEETTEERQHRKLFVWNYSCLTFIVIKLLLSGNIERVSKYALYPTLIPLSPFRSFPIDPLCLFHFVTLVKKGTLFARVRVCVWWYNRVGIGRQSGKKKNENQWKSWRSECAYDRGQRLPTIDLAMGSRRFESRRAFLSSPRIVDRIVRIES